MTPRVCPRVSVLTASVHSPLTPRGSQASPDAESCVLAQLSAVSRGRLCKRRSVPLGHVYPEPRAVRSSAGRPAPTR